jgi:hypothetical protein
MKDARTAKVIETKRKPPMWSVKAGARYVASFSGNDARQLAIAHAAINLPKLKLLKSRCQSANKGRAVVVPANPSNSA